MNRLNTICDKLAKDTGVDPRIMYCQSTGMPIGSLSDDSLRDLFASCTPGDDDVMSDELLTRTLASARPSPAWNKFERATLDRLRHSNPTLLLAYLLNRLSTPLRKSGDNQFNPHIGIAEVHGRITVYSWCARLKVEEKTLNQLLLVLLDLDVRWNLLRLVSPVNIIALIDKGDQASLEEALMHLRGWFDDLYTKELEAIRRQKESDRSFVNGNKLTRVAYMQEYIRQKPPSERQAAIIAKEHKKQDDLEWLDSLETSLQAALPAPTRGPVRKTVLLKVNQSANETARHGITQAHKVPRKFGVRS